MIFIANEWKKVSTKVLKPANFISCFRVRYEELMINVEKSNPCYNIPLSLKTHRANYSLQKHLFPSISPQ